MNAQASPRIRIEPRGLCRTDAAAYVGVGTSKFDEMVLDGRMPHPKRVDGRVLWDRFALDDAWDNLPSDQAENPLDAMLKRS